VVEYIDYSDEFPDVIAAQGAGRNVLILREVAPFKRADGKRGKYELEYRWLSRTVETPKDQAWACVLGQEYTYWQFIEIRKFLRSKRRNLFNYFKLWS
jgi:hypothetical protein